MTRDRLIGLTLCIAGGILIVSALQIRRVIPIGIGPGAFPVVLAGLLAVLGLALMVRRTNLPAPRLSRLAPRTVAALALFIGISAFALLAFEPVGFVVTGAVIVVVVGRMLQARWPVLVPAALLAPLTIQVVFENAFSVPLPVGVLAGLVP